MGQLDGFALAGENDRVFADHRAAAQGGKADAAGLARAGVAIADPDRVLAQSDPAAFGCGLAEQQSRSRWRIDLVAVVHFQHLDVPVAGVQRLRRLAHQHREQVDAEAHVAGLDDAGMARGGMQPGLVAFVHAGGADDMDNPRLGGEIGEFERCLGRGEIEHAFGPGENRQRVVGDGHAVRAEPGEFTRILAEHLRSGPLDGAGQMDTVNLGDGADQRLAHAAGGADDDQPHASGCCCHGLPPFVSVPASAASETISPPFSL